MRSYRIQRVYQHPIGKVWRALTTPDLLERWLMPNDFQPVVGHNFTLRTDPGPGFDGVVHCQVLEMEPQRRMVWSWKGGPIDTQISFELVELGAATELTVVHTGFRGFKASLVGRFLKLGSRKIYGQNLTQVLDGLEGGGMPTQPSLDPECMGPKQRFLRGLLARLTGK